MLVGSVAKPYEPNVGAHGAAFGLLGMNLVELIQAWQLVKRPEVPLAKLTALCVLGLATGLMPQVRVIMRVRSPVHPTQFLLNPIDFFCFVSDKLPH